MSGHTIKKSRKRLRTRSCDRARPAEPGAGCRASPLTDLPLSASWRAGRRILPGGFSWRHARVCAERSLVHTARAGGASSCGGCFERWRGPNGWGWSTGTADHSHIKSNTSGERKLLLLLPFTFPATKGIFLCFGTLGKAAWHGWHDFCGRRERVWASRRNTPSPGNKRLHQKSKYFGDLWSLCLFLLCWNWCRQVEVRDQLILQLWGTHTFHSSGCFLWKIKRELCSKENDALTWSAFSCTSRRSRSSFRSFSSKIASFVWMGS